MGIEFELKYSATPAQQAAIRESVTESGRTIPMETTYYDTPTGDLSARRYTLRRRLENGTSVCTVKTPAGNLGRGEWEVECEAIGDAILELCKLGAPKDLLFWAEQSLTPICGAKFTRTAYTVAMEGCTVELALDAGILTGGGKQIPLCEVEVELKEGSRQAAVAYAQALAAKFGLTAQPSSKFRRALALAKGE